jgi:hypothetical protein
MVSQPLLLIAAVVVVREDIPTNVSKPVVRAIADSTSQLNNEEALTVSTHAVERLAARLIIFEEEVRYKRDVYTAL